MNATNLIAKYSPESSSGEVVIIAAHYDSRDRAERDENPDLRDNPIDGANDGASGVGVLFELLPIIPNMNLSHDVWLILFDAEDQELLRACSLKSMGSEPYARGNRYNFCIHFT